LNERIRVTPVRVIDQDQKQLGIIPVEEALNLARSAGLDLVEVSPNETPPVCRIQNYGKQVYETKKRQKNAAHSHTVTLKEIRLRPKTDSHDRMIKMNRAKQFLDQGHKVQFTMLFRGRERSHRDLAAGIFNEILAELGEEVKVERHPFMEGRRMTLMVSPVKKKTGGSSSSNKPKKIEVDKKPAVLKETLAVPQITPDAPQEKAVGTQASSETPKESPAVPQEAPAVTPEKPVDG